ncbi:hypothetical protein D1871_08855 [Nakamurella silvestris]|nr:hypothetical protein D1871_08855 [Nakamurella silvestris]
MAAALLTGCTSARQEAAGTTTVTADPAVTAPVVSDPWPETTNDLASGSLHREIKLPGEDFTITVDYWVDFDITTWQTALPKKVNYSVHLEPVKDTTTPTVLVGSMTGTASLMSLTPWLDGLPQNSATDQPAALPGYTVNKGYPYEGHLTIDGISTSLAQRWNQFAPGLSLDEAALQTAGVHGTRLTFDIGLLVKSAGESNWHRRAVSDVLTVPVTPVEKATPVTDGSGTAAPTS